jgi:hypothetical protein
MQPPSSALDHIGLDVADYAPLGLKLIMEPVAEVGGFGDDFPFFWIARRGRGPDPDGNNVEAVCHAPG